MKKFREFAQVNEAKAPSNMTPEFMHKIIVDRLKELNVDRQTIAKMPRPSSAEWYEAYEDGAMLQLTKYMVVPPKNLGAFGFVYEIFSAGVTVGGSEDGAVIHLDIKFEYKKGGRNGTDWVDRYDPNKGRWSI